MAERIIGIDAGMGALKLYSEDGAGTEFPSQVSIARRQKKLTRMVGLRSARPPLRVRTDHGVFYVGQESHNWGRPVENLDYERLAGTPEMQALLYGALTHAQYTTNPAPMTIFVGLPLEPLSGEGGPANVKAVKKWITGTHSWVSVLGEKDTSHTINVANVKVTSQPVGALFDHALDEQGNLTSIGRKALGGEVGVISIGFNTLELLVVRNRHPMPDISMGTKLGVRRLLNIVDGNGYYTYTLAQLDEQLREGSLDVSTALPVWESEIWGAIEELWGSTWRRFDAVLVVGGGAILLREGILRRFGGKAIVPQAPVMSIARGLYKLGLYSQRRGRK